MTFIKRSLGQNFLIDKNIIKRIVNLVNIKNKHIVEIGPGQGALTDEILKKKPKTLKIIEKDTQLAKKLKIKHAKNKIVNTYNADILNFDFEKIVNKNAIIFGNLPYNISSQILVKIIKFKKNPPNYDSLILMFQKELGEKIIAKFPSKKYGRLSILTSYKLNVKNKFLVSPNCFFPKPKINSLVIHLQPNKKFIVKIKDINNLEKLTNILFNNKRKMINKVVKKNFKPNEIKSIFKLNLNLRPAEIKPEDYYKITQKLERH